MQDPEYKKKVDEEKRARFKAKKEQEERDNPVPKWVGGVWGGGGVVKWGWGGWGWGGGSSCCGGEGGFPGSLLPKCDAACALAKPVWRASMRRAAAAVSSLRGQHVASLLRSSIPSCHERHPTSPPPTTPIHPPPATAIIPPQPHNPPTANAGLASSFPWRPLATQTTTRWARPPASTYLCSQCPTLPCAVHAAL